MAGEPAKALVATIIGAPLIAGGVLGAKSLVENFNMSAEIGVPMLVIGAVVGVGLLWALASNFWNKHGYQKPYSDEAVMQEPWLARENSDRMRGASQVSGTIGFMGSFMMVLGIGAAAWVADDVFFYGAGKAMLGQTISDMRYTIGG